ncbi:MAG: response regulator transcription factor [Opitutaceae bacterium]|nr:response regulator transcription factor [Opitutaceae bacterium]
MLLIGHSGVANAALAPWLAEQPGLTVCHPSGSVPQLLDFATKFQPHVVLLDFHRRDADVADVIARIKALWPTPIVFMLTHDASPAMRRRCGEARVDMMFDKTAELGPLAETLSALADHLRTRALGSMEPALRGASHLPP